jgi:hypothetical protein
MRPHALSRTSAAVKPGAGAQAAEICEALRSLDRSRLGWGLDFALQARPGGIL